MLNNVQFIHANLHPFAQIKKGECTISNLTSQDAEYNSLAWESILLAKGETDLLLPAT